MSLTLPLVHGQVYNLLDIIDALPVEVRPSFYILTSDNILVETNVRVIDYSQAQNWPFIAKTSWKYCDLPGGITMFALTNRPDNESRLTVTDHFINAGLLNPALVDKAMKAGVTRAAALENRMTYDHITFDLEDLTEEDNKMDKSIPLIMDEKYVLEDILKGILPENRPDFYITNGEDWVKTDLKNCTYDYLSNYNVPYNHPFDHTKLVATTWVYTNLPRTNTPIFQYRGLDTVEEVSDLLFQVRLIKPVLTQLSPHGAAIVDYIKNGIDNDHVDSPTEIKQDGTESFINAKLIQVAIPPLESRIAPKLISGKQYSLTAIMAMMAEDEVYELRADIHDGDSTYLQQKIQIHHLTKEQLLSIPELISADWHYVSDNDGRYTTPPVFYYSSITQSRNTDITWFVNWQSLILPNGELDLQNLWVTFKGFPIEQPYKLKKDIRLFITGNEDDIGASAMVGTLTKYMATNFSNIKIVPTYINFAPGVGTFGDYKVVTAENKADIWHIPTMPKASDVVNYLTAIKHTLSFSNSDTNVKTILLYIEDKPWDCIIHQKFSNCFNSFCTGRITTHQSNMDVVNLIASTIVHDIANNSIN